jgi:predicted alpha/beta-fold hydrolase
LYTAACSQDVRTVLEHLSGVFPGAPLALAGFSLGGNIVLKLAGEAAEQPLPALRAIAAVAPPIDLVLCSERMANCPVYDAFYVRELTRQVQRHQGYFPDLPRIVFPRRLTLRQFDEMYTAPRWGYDSALAYYRDASALARIAAIRQPTFILTARDDPFVAVEPFERLQAPAHLEVHITRHGGHLGFLGRDETGGIRWAETQIVNWLGEKIARSASK